MSHPDSATELYRFTDKSRIHLGHPPKLILVRQPDGVLSVYVEGSSGKSVRIDVPAEEEVKMKASLA